MDLHCMYRHLSVSNVAAVVENYIFAQAGGAQMHSVCVQWSPQLVYRELQYLLAVIRESITYP